MFRFEDRNSSESPVSNAAGWQERQISGMNRATLRLHQEVIMRDVNKVLLIGRLGADPVSRETPSGVALTRFSVATSMRKRGESRTGELEGSIDREEEKESTVWHRVVAWGKEGEVCARYLKKGAPVFVEGRIRQNRYMTKEGQTRTDLEVHADRVSFLPSGGTSAWSSPSEAMESASASILN
jgi:single-strand DNA-binding protein